MSMETPDTETEEMEGTDDQSTAGEPEPTRADLEAQVDLLTEENRRLRREYARVRTSQYRRTALGLLALGVVAIAGGLLFPGARTVLFVLGATGLFGGLLTYYLTPERFVAASVGERVYAAFASTADGAVTDLGLSETRLYVPVDDGEGTRLFVPQHDAFELPDADALESTFVTPDVEASRGFATDPTGERLFAEFDRARTGPLEDRPGPLAEQLVDALVEQFELADSVRVEVDGESGQVTFGVSGSPYGAVDRFDHPVASFLAVGMARGLGAPVTLSVTEGDDRSDYLVTVGRVEVDG